MGPRWGTKVTRGPRTRPLLLHGSWGLDWCFESPSQRSQRHWPLASLGWHCTKVRNDVYHERGQVGEETWTVEIVWQLVLRIVAWILILIWPPGRHVWVYSAHFPHTGPVFASGHVLLLNGYDADQDCQVIFFLFLFTPGGISSKIRHIIFDWARKQ